MAPRAWSTFEGGTEEWKGGDGCGASFPDADMLLCAGQTISCHLCRASRVASASAQAARASGAPHACMDTDAGACPHHIGCGCNTTSLIKRTMQKYDLGYPEPMGPKPMPCCGCCPDGRGGLCSACLCHECMLCLVWRELKIV